MVCIYLYQSFGQRFRSFRHVLLLFIGHDDGGQQTAQTDDDQWNVDGEHVNGSIYGDFKH